MRFKIGDPVWHATHCEGKWIAAVIVGVYPVDSVKCGRCGEIESDQVIYEVVNTEW